MKTTTEIHDLIQTCEFKDPNAVECILNILEHLNSRLAKLEGEVERLTAKPKESNAAQSSISTFVESCR